MSEPTVVLRDGLPAIDVKDRSMYWNIPLRDDLEAIGEAAVERIYDGLREGFWENYAPEIARGHGYGNVYADGRSGGWLVVEGVPEFWEYDEADLSAAKSDLEAARRYEATFSPEAWSNDYAVPVDPEGETSWDCTATVLALPADYFHHDEAHSLSGWVDRDDVLKDDPAAPEWIREWRGPFTIRVKGSGETEYDDAYERVEMARAREKFLDFARAVMVEISYLREEFEREVREEAERVRREPELRADAAARDILTVDQ